MKLEVLYRHVCQIGSLKLRENATVQLAPNEAARYPWGLGMSSVNPWLRWISSWCALHASIAWPKKRVPRRSSSTLETEQHCQNVESSLAICIQVGYATQRWPANQKETHSDIVAFSFRVLVVRQCAPVSIVYMCCVLQKWYKKSGEFL